MKKYMKKWIYVLAVLVGVLSGSYILFGLFSTQKLIVDAQTSSPLPSNCPRFLQGDADCNGILDNTDYACWLTAYTGGTPSSSCQSEDYSNDGTVNLIDYEVWRRNYYTTSASTPSPVQASPIPTQPLTPTPTLTLSVTPSAISPTPVSMCSCSGGTITINNCYSFETATCVLSDSCVCSTDEHVAASPTPTSTATNPTPVSMCTCSGNAITSNNCYFNETATCVLPDTCVCSSSATGGPAP